MTILLILADQHGVGFQRGLQPYHWLARMAGHNVVCAPSVPMGPPAPGQDPGKFSIDRGNYDWDVVVAQIARDPDAEAFLTEYKRRGGRIIYEIDDSYRNIPMGNPARANVPMEMIERIERIIGLADAATTTTENLASYYGTFQPNIHVCRNALDPNQYGPLLDAPPRTNDGTFRVGWAGSQGHLRDIEMIVRPVTRFLKARPHARFIIGGGDLRYLWPRTVHHQMQYAGSTFDIDTTDPKKQKVKLQYGPGERTPAERYPQFLYDMALHAAIAPIQHHDWNAAKSELKLLEYGAIGIPAIASDWGPYRAYMDRSLARTDLPGPVCLLAGGEDDWLAHLLTLCDDADLRDRMSRANRHYVLTEHLIHHRLHEWTSVIDSLPPSTRARNAAEVVARLRAESAMPKVFA